MIKISTKLDKKVKWEPAEQEQSQEEPLLKGLYRKPFHYDEVAQTVFDSDTNPVLDVRGWGRIQKMENAEQVQDAVGYYLTKLLNEYWPEPEPPTVDSQKDPRDSGLDDSWVHDVDMGAR